MAGRQVKQNSTSNWSGAPHTGMGRKGSCTGSGREKRQICTPGIPWPQRPVPEPCLNKYSFSIFLTTCFSEFEIGFAYAGWGYREKAGDEIHIKYVLDLRDFPGDPAQEVITHDFEEIINDEEVQIIVEVMGGIEPAYTFVKRSLLAGKNVVTSNKALVAKHGAELIRVAKEQNVNFFYEASVGGGIPILRSLYESLTGDVIEEIVGILNGTTNYMMTKMFYEGAGYDDVLKEAQDNGFAERNPEADVEGYDACRKIAILASIISGKQVDFEDLYCKGITKVTVEDMQYAKVMGRTVKLLATCKRHGETLSAMVSPCLLSQAHPLFSVNGVFNSVFVHGNMLGDAMFYGSGAGKLPTASAVVADVVDEAKHLHRNIMTNWSSRDLELMDLDDVEGRFFVRVKDISLDDVDKAFGKVDDVIEAYEDQQVEPE